ncbi:MAG: PAS domain S-box protein [Desulfobacteraceae bacterium]|nr:MAG: PAS domain S-box protein [Desulfobacteraceae bacterium]
MHRDTFILTTILDTLTNGIYVVSEDYKVLYMNRTMIGWFGDGVGKKCHEVINSSRALCPWCRCSQILEGESGRREVYVPKADRTFEIDESPVRMPDGTLSKLSIYQDITHRKQREARLKATVEDYRTIFEHVAVGVYISTKEGKFVDANQALVDMLGYASKEEFLKIDIIRDLYLFPDDRQRFQAMIERDGRVVDYEVQFKRKDGNAIPVLMTSHVRYDHQGNVIGYEGINVDQSQRYQMERKLREAHDFMNKIIGSAPISIMAADLNGNIIIWNKMAEKTLGYSAEEVIGKLHITKVYPEGKAYEIMKTLRSREQGGVGVFPPQPVLYVRQDGKIIEGNLSAAMIYDDDGNETATVGSFVDLTERIDMERALSRTQQQLLHSEKLAAMGRLTSQVAHELNNPLYGIMNTLELLKSEVPEGNKRRKLLDMSLSEIVRLADMLKKMLSFSKPEQEIKKPVDVNTIADEILMLHEKQLKEHNIIIKTDFDPGIPQVHASTNQLRQVFLNMVSNARDAMPEGGTLTVKSFMAKGFVNMQFADTGVGIKQENIGRIFDSFFTTKSSVKGVGLGLSVCYGFIKDHGGDIRVDSAPGEGAAFTISLPEVSSEKTE